MNINNHLSPFYTCCVCERWRCMTLERCFRQLHSAKCQQVFSLRRSEHLSLLLLQLKELAFLTW